LNAAIIAASPAQLPGGINVGAELGGQTLVAGVYQSPSGAYGITSVDLTLNRVVRMMSGFSRWPARSPWVSGAMSS
jgi:hypothetical protein